MGVDRVEHPAGGSVFDAFFGRAMRQAAYPRPRSGTGLVPHPVFKTGCPS